MKRLINKETIRFKTLEELQNDYFPLLILNENNEEDLYDNTFYKKLKVDQDYINLCEKDQVNFQVEVGTCLWQHEIPHVVGKEFSKNNYSYEIIDGELFLYLYVAIGTISLGSFNLEMLKSTL